jgi:hypothetical protein
MMHDSSCGCPDCANFHPNRFANVGVPTPPDRSADQRRQRDAYLSRVAEQVQIGNANILSALSACYDNGWQARGRLLEEENRDWSLTIERIAGKECAVLRVPGKMDTTTPVLTRQLPWFNALRNLLGRKVGA